MWEFLFIEHRAHIQHAILFSLCVFAWLKGDGPEKWSANILSGMVVLDYALHWTFQHSDHFDRIVLSHLLLDLLVLVALIPVAVRANRIYPLCILAAQLLAVVMHLNRGLAPEGMEFAYWLLTRVPSYIQIIALATGLYLHRRRARRYGPYRSWKTSSHR